MVDTFRARLGSVPSHALERQFSEKIGPIFKMVAGLQSRNTVLRRTRDLLLPRLVSGEVDVSGLEIGAADG